jgi:hypothetical protein
MRRTAFLILLSAIAAWSAPARGADARSAVEAFVARLAGVEIRDVVVHQAVTLFHRDGRHPKSVGEQRLFIKVPGRQRLEQVIDGRREVRLMVSGRAWVRRADGTTYEAPPTGNEREQSRLLIPLRRSADDLLAEWRALGVRDGVAHEDRLAGRPVTVIGARPGERLNPAVWLDSEYGVVRFVTREKVAKGTALIDLAFSEHRPLLGGFHFPHRQEAFVGGTLLVLVVVKSIVANTDVPDALFDPDALRRENQ